MKKINQEEFDKLSFKGRGRHNPALVKLMSVIDTLEVGGGMEIAHKEWPVKSYPGAYLYQYYVTTDRESRKFTTRTLANGKAWVIQRTV